MQSHAGRGVGKGRIASSLNSMRWMMIALLVSVVALLVASAGLALHIWQQRRRHGRTSHAFGRADEVEIETEEAP